MRHISSTLGVLPKITCPDRLIDPATGKCNWQKSSPSAPAAGEESNKTGYIIAGVVVLAAAAGAFWWATKK